MNNLFDLSGKVAIVTGASRGIGQAIAERFAEAGAKVVLSSRKQDGLDRVADGIRSKGGEALAVDAHNGDKAALQGLVKAAVNAYGRVDILINNGGGGIFNIIKGPRDSKQNARYFDAKHQFNAQYLARAFGVEYFSARSEEEIINCCKRLKLSRNLAERSQTTDGTSHQEYLYQLLAGELRNRELGRTAKLINSAGFYSIKTFDGFRFDEITLPSGLTPEKLKSLEFIRENKNIIMYGRTGTGKTMLSTALGVSACQKGIPVKFYRTAALVNQLSETKKAGTLGAFLKKLRKASLIILDEWGYVPYDRTGAQLLFDYLSEIHEDKCVILNTNL